MVLFYQGYPDVVTFKISSRLGILTVKVFNISWISGSSYLPKISKTLIRSYWPVVSTNISMFNDFFGLVILKVYGMVLLVEILPGLVIFNDFNFIKFEIS